LFAIYLLVIPSSYCGDVETVSGDAAVCTYWVEGVALVSYNNCHNLGQPNLTMGGSIVNKKITTITATKPTTTSGIFTIMAILEKMIFGMQRYCNPTRLNMEEYPNILKMEDNLNVFQLEGNPNILVNGRQPQKI
jgi:hypothetical protein